MKRETHILLQSNSKYQILIKCTKMLKNSIKTHEQDANKCKEVILDLKARSMRENLISYGITETSQGTNEKCDELVKDLIQTHLKMDNVSNITLDRAHRFDAKYNGKMRPIMTTCTISVKLCV